MLREQYRDPNWWRWRFIDYVVRPYLDRTNPQLREGIDVLDMEWDNLIVLDACRADLFEEAVDTSLFDEYRREISHGSATSEWTTKNFEGKSCEDTVYVSGNPHTSIHAGDSFHALIEVWQSDFDDDIGTVLPEDMTAASRTTLDQHPEKRLIVHFMQPHHPFLSDDDLRFDGVSATRTENGIEINHQTDRTPWDAFRDGQLDDTTVWNAYRDNLEIAMDEVLPLARDLPGRTVITSDHGNAFGERPGPFPTRIYGHPARMRLRSLVEVPWAVIDGPRREIEAGDVSSRSTASQAEVEDRLQALGYAE